MAMTVTIVSEKPGEDKSVMKATIFRRDSDDSFLLLIDQPAVDNGKAYLKSGEFTWMFDPKTKQTSTIKLSDKFQNTDADNGDFKASSLSEDYNVVKGEEVTLGKQETYKVTLEAKNTTVTYSKKEMWISKDKLLPLKEIDYAKSGRASRIFVFNNWVKVQGHWLPKVQFILDQITIGQKTQVNIENPSFMKISDDKFNKSYLEKISEK
jgi:hypothetical protein